MAARPQDSVKMQSIVHTIAAVTLPSPTLTNPEMVLPDEAAAYITKSPPRTDRPPSPSYLLDQVGDKNAPTKAVTPKKSLGAMSRRRGLQRSTTEEDNYTALSSSPAHGIEAAEARPDMQRKASFVSTSTTSLDWDAIPDYKYDGEESDIVTLDGVGSGTATPTRSPRGESPAARLRTSSRSRSRSRKRTESSSAELSRRAELILANAKKRLNLMDQNLKGARALTAENLQRAASMHAHRSPYTNRYFTSNTSSETPESPAGLKIGHVRGRSDNTIIHPPVRSPTAIAAEIVHEESEEPTGWAPTPLRASKSQELPQMRSLRSLRSSSRLQSTLRESTPISPGTPSSGRGSSDAGSSPATTELKHQVQELNRRVSMLRDRTREDSLRRQSFQNLRQPNPLTDAERYQNSLSGRTGTANPSQAALISRWSVDSSVKRQSTFIPGDSPTSIYSRPSEHEETKDVKRKSKQTDWRPVEPSKKAELSRFSMDSEAGISDNEVDVSEVEELIDPGSNTNPISPTAHEDRADAFDYHNFFLHSTLGRASHMSDETSEGSEDTARGPAMDSLPEESETPEKLRDIERTIHKRFSSIDSLSSDNSFATATEGVHSRQPSPTKRTRQPSPAKRTRQPSPVKRAEGSDGADSGVGMQDRGKNKDVSHKRALSSHISAQVQAIAAPPSAIAVAALAAPGKRPLGLRDRALTLMLLECIRHACEKLQDQDLDASEGRILRRRIEEARKVMDGTAPVVS
ncbi:hypothetical protein C1H76_3913 [Elsinoe australis]|uniref:Uncharacterized protein n=1 Tax=Elsinoe australis TaxID=40998 RepID=A0A4U7B2R7_9PEZI|nr:hypothetical protein C1H76_3913 [Elsinoe australis]